jgi:hypothetical protein
VADFYLDNDVSIHIAIELRAAGHGALSSRDTGMRAAKDGRQLLAAAQRGWILITHNFGDFDILHDAWLGWSAAWGVIPRHAGILVVPQATLAERAQGRMGHQEVAALILALLATGSPSANEFWRWKRVGGWVREG